VTLTFVRTTVPVLVTVPEKRIPTPLTQPSAHVSVTAMLAVSQVQVELAVLEFTVPAQGDAAVPWAVTLFVTSPPAAQATVQAQATDWPGFRVPSEPELHWSPVTLTLVRATVPVFVTVPEKRIPTPPTQPSAHVSVTAMLADSQVQVTVLGCEVTVPKQFTPGSPEAVAVFEMSPPVVQFATQLQGADWPGLRVPMFTFPQAVFVTTTLVRTWKPLFVTVPEKVIPVPPTQPSEQVWVISRSQVSIWPRTRSLSWASSDCEDRVSAMNDEKPQIEPVLWIKGRLDRTH
jgi:hypothetical protein